MKPCTTLERLRKPKVADMSIFDWVASLLGAYIVGAWLLKLRGTVAWAAFVAAWVGFGVAVHWWTGVPTMLGYYLGLNEKPVRAECA